MSADDSVLQALWRHPDALTVIEAPTSEECFTVVWANDAFERMYGFKPEAVIGTPLSSLWVDPDLAADDVAHAQTRGRTMGAMHRLGGGGVGAVDLILASSSCAEGVMRCIFLHRHHAPSRPLARRAQEAEFTARRAEQRLWDAIEAMPEGFMILDHADRIVAFNSKIKAIYEKSAPAFRVGATLEHVMRYGMKHGQYPEAVGNEDAWLLERLDRRTRTARRVERRLPDGRHILVQDVEAGNGDLVGLRTDITAYKKQSEDLKEKARALTLAESHARTEALTDALTGLGNRRGLDMVLEELTRLASPPQEVALLHIDLDRFKGINDMFGHAAGDHVLAEVARILESSVRPSDYVARVGGDEFVILLVGGTDIEEASVSIAERIVSRCSRPMAFEDKELRFGSSIGIARATTDTLDGLLENADIALYEAKGHGRGCHALFTPKLRQVAEDKKKLADQLMTAMAEDQLSIYLQPQLNAHDHSLAGAEALVRWEHPEEGVLAPARFLPLADELGLLADIDERVLQLALSSAKEMTSRGLLLPKISVNVSYRRLKNPLLLECLDDWHERPCRVAFELLETIDFDQDADGFAWMLDRLREDGIEIEIDDFGSGHASLTTLLRLLPDRLKIDRMLVTSMEAEVPGARQMVKAIGDICQSAGIGLTAEGVETQEMAEALTALGASVLQGYLYSRPLSLTGFESWARARQLGLPSGQFPVVLGGRA